MAAVRFDRAPRPLLRGVGARQVLEHVGAPVEADAGDDDRGLTILEWGQDPVHHAWPDQPRYRVMGLSSVIDNAATLLAKDMHVRVQLDIEISYEEANFIKETFMAQFEPRELSLMPTKKDELSIDPAQDGEFVVESVDQIVYNQLGAVDSDVISSDLLIQIYKDL